MAPLSLVLASVQVGPIKLTGNIGYSLRDVIVSKGARTSSHQFRAGINTQSYFWQPWFATESLRLNLVQDISRISGSGTTRTNLLTGDALLNVLPQSHTPFKIAYRVSDTKVNRISLADVPVSFSGGVFNSARLSVTQSLLTDVGHRFQVRYDNSHWRSGSGTYSDDAFGLDASLKLVKQRLAAQLIRKNIQNGFSEQKESRFVINVDHDYVPSSALRVDSMLNLLNEDKVSLVGGAGRGVVDSRQLSSFVFWRPDNSPLAVSGGVRMYNIDASGNGVNTAQGSVSGSLGGFYQYSKHVRFDGSWVVSRVSNASNSSQGQQRLGALYQSDVIGLGKQLSKGAVIFPWSYQWYADSVLTNSTLGQRGSLALSQNSLGHNISRSWRRVESLSIRFGFSQRVTGSLGNDSAGSVLLLNQSGSLGLNNSSADGGASAQLSVSDSRGVRSGSRQLVNFQLAANRALTRQSSLSGSLTTQHIRQKSARLPDKKSTTLSGRVAYQHDRVLGISRLQFFSDVYMSRAALSNSLNRAELNERLSYRVGQTESQLSFKWINSGVSRYTLLYFQVTRNF